MNRQRLFIAIGLLALFWVAAAVLVRADAPKRGDVAAARPITQATIPAPPEGMEVSLAVFPDRVCPGCELYYSFRLTNTSQTSIPTGMRAIFILPDGTWFDDSNFRRNLGGNFGLHFQGIEYIGDQCWVWFEWILERVIDPGGGAEAFVRLRTDATLPQDRVITSTFFYGSTPPVERPWPAPLPYWISVEPS